MEPESVRRVRAAYDVEYDKEVVEIPADRWEDDDGSDLFVGAVVRNADDEVLLVWNQWSDGWIGPGGTVEPGETLEEAAIREVREETDVGCEIERPVSVTRTVFQHGNDPERTSTGHFVLFEARATDAAIDVDGGVEGETIHDADWFGEIPDETPQPGLLAEYL